MDKIIEYFQENPLYFWIAAALLAVLIILVVAAIIGSVRGARKNKLASEDQNVRVISPADEAALPEDSEQRADDADEASFAAAVQEQDAAEDPPASADAWEEAPAAIGDEYRAEAEAPEEKAVQAEEEAAEAVQPAEEEPVQEIVVPAEEVKEVEPAPAPAAQARKEAATAEAESEEAPAPVTAAAAVSERSSEDQAADARIRRAEKIADAKFEKKKAPAKPAKTEEKQVASPTKTEEEDKRSAYTGKWVIIRNPNGSYHFELRASNGEKLLSSIDYTSLSGAKNGIKTHKANIQKDNLVTSQNKKGQFFFKLLSGSKQLLCTGETYPTKAGCESAIDSVKRFAETAVVTIQEEDEE